MSPLLSRFEREALPSNVLDRVSATAENMKNTKTKIKIPMWYHWRTAVQRLYKNYENKRIILSINAEASYNSKTRDTSASK